MTDDEWRAVCLHMEEGWKGDMTEERRAVYATFLKDQEASVVMDALKRLAADGQPWLPTVPELTVAIRGVADPGPPAWDQAWALMEPVLRNANALGEAESVRRIAEVAGPVVAGWVAAYGAVRLAMEPIHEPQFGGAVLKRIAASYTEQVATDEGRQRLALGTERAAELGRREAARLVQTTGVGLPD